MKYTLYWQKVKDYRGNTEEKFEISKNKNRTTKYSYGKGRIYSDRVFLLKKALESLITKEKVNYWRGQYEIHFMLAKSERL